MLLRPYLFLSNVIFLALFATSVAAHQVESANCGDLFRHYLSQLFVSDRVDEFSTSTRMSIRTPTCKSVGEVGGVHGGKLIKLERVEKTWVSQYSTVTYDPQGDPRWFIDTIGDEASEFFGFKMLSDKQMLVPNAQEFMGAIDRVNKALREKGLEEIKIRFYPTHDELNTKVALYTKEFKENAALPFAPSGNHMLHDLSFHTGAIYIPQKFIRNKMAWLEYEDEFFKFVREKYKNSPEQLKAIKHYQHITRLKNTAEIDTETGTLALKLLDHMKSMKKNPTASLAGTHFGSPVYFTGGTQSPYERFRFTIEALDGAEGFKYLKREEFTEALPFEAVADDLKKFTETYSSKQYPDFKPKNLYGPMLDQQNDYCRGITERLGIIRETALKLQNKKAPSVH